jgi:hypothetical protein
VDVDERDGLTDVDGQLARNKIARVIADNTNFQRFCLQFDFCRCFHGLVGCFGRVRCVFRIAGSTVVLIVPTSTPATTATRAVIVPVLGKCEPVALMCGGLEQQQAACRRGDRLCGSPAIPARCERSTKDQPEVRHCVLLHDPECD